MGKINETTNDAELLRRCADEPEAFRLIYDRHAEVIHAWLASRTGSPELALDITAETFAEAFRVARRFRSGDSDARPWLIGIASNLLLVAWRSRRVETRARVRLGILEETRVASDDSIDSIIARLDVAEQAPAIERALASLSKSQRVAVELRVTKERSYAEIAEALGCSTGSARLLVFRGLRSLNHLLGDADAYSR